MTTYTDRQKACIEVAVALEQQRALKIVEAVRKQGFSKSGSEIPTQAEAVFDLACEEIEHRLRTEAWELDGVPAPLESTSPVADRDAVLYEHEDGRYAVAPSDEAATFTSGDPKWHRVGPVTLHGFAAPVAGFSEATPVAYMVRHVDFRDNDKLWRSIEPQFVEKYGADSNYDVRPLYDRPQEPIHDSVACSLVNGRGMKCTCDAADDRIESAAAPSQPAAPADEVCAGWLDHSFGSVSFEPNESAPALPYGKVPVYLREDAAPSTAAQGATLTHQAANIVAQWIKSRGTSMNGDAIKCHEVMEAAAPVGQLPGGMTDEILYAAKQAGFFFDEENFCTGCGNPTLVKFWKAARASMPEREMLIDVGVIAHDELYGWHFAPTVAWDSLGIGRPLYAIETPPTESTGEPHA